MGFVRYLRNIRIWYLVPWFISFLRLTSHSQENPIAQFDFPSNEYEVCLGTPVKILNSSENALQYLWDFCPENFTETPVFSSVVTIPGLVNGWGYKMVHHDDQWTAFLVSRNSNKIYRLDFGNDPSSTPVVSDLGNPGNLFVSPQGLDIVQQNGNWYGFMGKGETTTGQIVRLDFGDNLSNVPIAVGLGTFGISGRRMRDVKIIKQNADWILAIILDTDNALLRINYRSSFDNALTTENISATGELTGANLTLGFSIIQHEGDWILHTVSYSNHGIQQYNFGSNLFGLPTFEGSFSFSSVTRPYFIKVIREGRSFFGFVGNENKSISVIKFGEFESQPQELPNATLPGYIGFDLVKHQSKNILQGTVNGSASFIQTIFENSSCPSEQTWSESDDPSGLTFKVAGDHAVELFAASGDSQSDVTSRSLNVSSLKAPDIQIASQNVCLSAPIEFSLSGNKTLQTTDWNFGDNTVSNNPAPSHVYAAPGQYTVQVEVTDIDNCATSMSYPLTVYPQPVSDFSLPASPLCTNNVLIFAAATPDVYSGNLSYTWFVDNSAVSTSRDLAYSFTTTEPKEIELRTSIPGCIDITTKTASSVEEGPLVDFSFSGVCEDESYSFQSVISTPIESLTWDFDNGQTSTSPNPAQSFVDAGNYLVSLKAMNMIGCETVTTKPVAVHSKPMVDFSLQGSNLFCSGASVIFQNETINADGNDITSWLWDFGDAHDLESDNALNGEHSFSEPGDYDVSLTATTVSGCVGSRANSITIKPSPMANFTSTPACEDVPVAFNITPQNDIDNVYWEIGTSYYNISSPTHTFNTAGDFPLLLKITGLNGCVSTRYQNIYVPDKLIPDFSIIKNCIGQEAILTDITSGSDPVLSRQWSIGNDESFSGSPLNHVFFDTGSHLVTMKITAQSGCAYQVSKTVDVLLPPVAQFTTSASSGASPLEVSFTNSSSRATHFLWEFHDALGNTSTQTSPVHTFSGPASYDVELTAYNAQQCEDSFKSTITTVSPLPDVDVDMINITTNTDGTAKLIVTIHNKGNTMLKALPVNIDFSGNLQLRHILQEPIMPATKFNLVLNTSIVNPETLRYLCVSLALDNDLSPLGNRMCQEFDKKLFLFTAYPNPASANLNIEWISDTNGKVAVSLLDRLGRRIFFSEVNASKGLNRHILNLFNVENGLYFLLVDDGADKITQRIVVLTNP